MTVSRPRILGAARLLPIKQCRRVRNEGATKLKSLLLKVNMGLFGHYTKDNLLEVKRIAYCYRTYRASPNASDQERGALLSMLNLYPAIFKDEIERIQQHKELPSEHFD